MARYQIRLTSAASSRSGTYPPCLSDSTNQWTASCAWSGPGPRHSSVWGSRSARRPAVGAPGDRSGAVGGGDPAAARHRRGRILDPDQRHGARQARPRSTRTPPRVAGGSSPTSGTRNPSVRSVGCTCRSLRPRGLASRATSSHSPRPRVHVLVNAGDVREPAGPSRWPINSSRRP